MVKERHKRPSSSQMPSDESLTSKKTRAPSSSSMSTGQMPMVVVNVKPEPGEGQLAAQVSARRRAAAVEEQTSPAVERVQFGLEFHLFHCDVTDCYGHLKPPVFMCEAGHLLCDACRAVGHCRCCNRAATFVPCPWADRFVHGAMVSCPYESAGCNVPVLYHDMPAHLEACAYAPCPCLAPSCAFSAAPPLLREHLTGDHAWPVHRLPSYAKGQALHLPAEESQHLLVVDGDALRVFLLSLHCGGAGAAVAVSVACLRASAAAGPHFKCTVWAEAAPDAPRHLVQRRLIMEADVAGCVVPGGPAPEEVMRMHVPVMLLGPSRVVVLRIRIDEVRRAPASAVGSANAPR